MIQIIPAILATTREDYQKDIERVNSSSSFEDGWVHIDFMDNKFVPNQSIDIDTTIEFESKLKKEAHLMVENPMSWITKLKEARFERIIFHFESGDDPQKVIDEVKDMQIEVGIAVNPETDIEKLKNLKGLDLILVMGVKPGFQGQSFVSSTVNKIRDLRLKNWGVKISTDGAVSDLNAKRLVEAGADILVIGSFLLKGDIDENAEKIWEVT